MPPVTAEPSRKSWTAFAVMAIVVGLATSAIFLPSLEQVIAARRWEQTTCTILRSWVVSAGGRSTTYRVGVRYQYEVGGHRYEGDRPQFMSGSSSGREAKEQRVAALPPGAEVPCFYDPGRPSSSVLDRGVTWEMLFILLPLTFVVVGVLGLRAGRGATPKVAVRLREPVTARGKKLLAPQVGRGARAAGMIAVALFWNGIVGVFVNQELHERSWFLGLFLVPFVLIGVGLFFAAIHAFLQIFNPVVDLVLAQGALTVGAAPVELRWTIAGNAGRFRALTIHLEGTVSATYTRGTDTVTDTEVFTKRELVAARDPRQIRAGAASVSIPTGSMCSFAAKNNKVSWQLCLEGDIPAWPDVSEKYPLEVRPATHGADAGYRAPAAPIEAARAEGDPSLRLLLARPSGAYQPGETVDGRFGWQLADDEATACTTIELRLFWRTAGKGTQDLEVVDRLPIDAPGKVGERPFALKLPSSPPSFSSRLVSVSWGLELVAVGVDRQTLLELVVGPGGREIVLPEGKNE